MADAQSNFRDATGKVNLAAVLDAEASDPTLFDREVTALSADGGGVDDKEWLSEADAANRRVKPLAEILDEEAGIGTLSAASRPAKAEAHSFRINEQKFCISK